MNSTTDPLAKLNPPIWLGVRVLVGLLWIQNVGWKYPPDFAILERSIQRGIDTPTWGPFSSFLDSVVIDNIVAFGWLTLISELVVGSMLLAGFGTRIAALIGAGQSLVIGLTTSAVDHEWGWSYWLMVAVHLALFAGLSGRFCGADGVLQSRSGGRNGSVTGEARRFLAVFGVGAVVFSVWMLSQTDGATGVRGPIKNDDLPWGDLATLNTTGAVLFTIAAVGTLAAGLIGKSQILWAAAASWTGLTIITLVVAFTQGTLLGASRPSTAGIALAMMFVTVVPALADRRPARA